MFVSLWFYGPVNIKVGHLTALFLEYYNYPPWFSRRGRMAVEIISWSISTKAMKGIGMN